jgi:uncharacterized membrane protein
MITQFYNPIVLRRIGEIVGISATAIGFTGAAIWQFVRWPYAAFIGFGTYVMLVIVLMALRIVSMYKWEPTLDELHTLAADTNHKVDELAETIHRNV